MARWRYVGPDTEIGDLGKVGHGSVVDLTAAQLEQLDATQFQEVSLHEPMNILPWGTIPYVPDVTGKSQDESVAATTAASQEAIRAAGKELTPKQRHDAGEAPPHATAHAPHAANAPGKISTAGTPTRPKK
jgi:hypothetical protein